MPRSTRESTRPVTRRTYGHTLRDAAQAGYSLVELLFVLLIVGVLTSMVTPLFGTGRWRADAAVQEVAMTLNAAQRLAVLRQHDVRITFRLAERRIEVLQDGDNDGVADDGEEWRVLDLPETVGFGSGTAPILPQGSGPVSFAEGGGAAALTFHDSGSASASGVIYLRPVEGSLSESPLAVRGLTVERATGQVRCWSYRSGSWEATC